MTYKHPHYLIQWVGKGAYLIWLKKRKNLKVLKAFVNRKGELIKL